MIAAAWPRRRARDAGTGEAGVTLILALAFVTVMGAFIVGLLTITDANFKATQVTRTRVDALYAADGGADFAIEQIRTTATSLCPPTLTAIPAINGLVPSVSLTCTGGTTTGSGSPLLGAYSAIALGAGGISIEGSAQAGDNLSVKFAGSLYSAGSVGGITGTGNSLTIDGDVALAGTPCSFNTTTDPKVTGSCLANQGVPSVAQAANTPTVVLPVAAAPAPQTSGNCTILYPGTYAAAPVFTTTKGYYLASGTYYFNGLGDIGLGGYIQGGAAGTTTPALTSGFLTRCPASFASDANAKTLRPAYNYTGTGVTIILGGNTVLRVQDDTNNRIELFPRVATTGSPDLAAKALVSIWGQMTSTTGTSASYVKMTQSQSYYTYGKLSDVVVHGLMWLPQSRVQLSPFSNSDAGGTGQLKGGVVADTIALFLDNITGGVSSTVAGSSSVPVATIRTVVITSVATPPGYAPLTVKVVATFPTTANGAPTIVSWRKA